jgi:hypothetical protein
MYSFRPQPEPPQLQALLVALERLSEGERRPFAYESEWRRAAIEEAVSPGDEDEASR